MKLYKVDILHLQEIQINEDTFDTCDFISSNFNIISNNSENKYGTASLIRSDLSYRNIRCDTSGRAIVFDVDNVTLGNFYGHSGSDNISRNRRESFFAETVPNLLVNSQQHGCIGGDLNMIIDKLDATKNPDAKMSPTFKRLVRSYSWRDSFRELHPAERQYSRYYANSRTEGATRIDRCYHYGDIAIKSAIYLPLAFSDHHAHLVTIQLPDPFSRLLSPRTYPSFRIKAEVVQDPIFQGRLTESMRGWKEIRSFGLDILTWWENLVKPGVKRLAQTRSRELNKSKHEYLNLLRLRQGYLNRKLLLGETWRLAELKAVHISIENWYMIESQKIKHQSLTSEYQQEEKVRIYHHELHQKRIKKSSILKSESPSGIIEGHQACAEYLENTVSDLLEHPVDLDQAAQEALLYEVQPVFTVSDNDQLLKVPSKKEVLDILTASNQHAAPGTDGLTSYFYKQCFDIMGDALTDVVQAVFSGQKPTLSQRTSKMVFGSKPKKGNSIKPSDKRRISLLNSDFKTISGIESLRFKKTATRTLSPLQLVAGDDRRIHHGINLARNAIQAASKFTKTGCGIADTDYQAAFDYLVMSWVFMVLKKKGVRQAVIDRLTNLYQYNWSIVVVNNMEGKHIKNNRLSLRQGDVPSMFFFAYGIDPLISYLESRLTVILIYSLPVHGPAFSDSVSGILPAIEERFKVISYADDLKPAITSMEEFSLVNTASAMFEAASGCRLHRNPSSNKCKFLPLGKWRRTLKQEDLPPSCQYMRLSDHLDMVGVELWATWSQTRKANGDMVQKRMSTTINAWKAGKFMPLVLRPWSINCFALSKVWFKCGSVNLRAADISALNSSLKSWLYADLLEKPSEAVMCRPSTHGGLGVVGVKFKSLALLIRTFLETAVIPTYRHSLLHSALYRYHILDDTSIPNPGFPPYYPTEFFQTIRNVHTNSHLNILTMDIGQWTRKLTEDGLTMQGSEEFTPCRAELSSPNSDWDLCWRLCRLGGLSSELASFNFKLIHGLLVTKKRQHHLNPRSSPICSHCNLQIEEDLTHALIQCSYNNGVGLSLVSVADIYIPDIHTSSLLRLELSNLSGSHELPLVTITSTILSSIWEKRQARARITLFDIRTTLEAKCQVLRETRFSNSSIILEEMISKL